MFTEMVYDGLVCNASSGSPYTCAIRRGASGSLNCSFRSIPEGSIDYATPPSSNATTSQDQLIRIAFATSDNAGEYTCTATNTVLGETRTVTREFRLYVGGW